MSKEITITYYGVDGKGPTVTAAKKDAGRKIEAMMKGDYTPRLIQYRHITMVLFRDPFRGWVYSSIENLAAMTATKAHSRNSSGVAVPVAMIMKAHTTVRYFTLRKSLGGMRMASAHLIFLTLCCKENAENTSAGRWAISFSKHKV